MAESEKKGSASAKSKEKNLLLDMDMGKDFLGSWESISVAEGDGMDFDIGPVSKGKKKAFDFGKEDFDFNLDGAFGKLSSFNIDMPDLDISPPLKKDENSKEKSDRSSKGKEGGKSSQFDFDFDFDKIGDFSIEPSPDKDDSRSQREKNKKESSRDERSDQEDKEGSMRTDPIGNMSTFKGVLQEPSVPETINFDMECQIGRSKDVEKPKEKFPSNVESDDAITSVHSAAKVELPSDRRSESPQRAIASRELPKTNQSEELGFAEPVEVNPCAPNANDANLDVSSDHLLNDKPKNSSVAEEKSDMDPNPTGSSIEQDVLLPSVSDLSDNNKYTMHEELQCLQSVAVAEKNHCDKNDVEQDVSLPSVSDLSDNNKYAMHEELQSLQSVAVAEKNHCGKNDVLSNDSVVDTKERIEPARVNSLVEKQHVEGPVSEVISKMPSARENLKTTSENFKLPLARQPNDQSEKEAMKRREPLVTSLRTFLQSEKLECPARKAAAQNTLLSSNSKKMDPTEPIAVGGRDSDGIQGSRKLLALQIQHSNSTTPLKDLPQKAVPENYKAIKTPEEVSADGLSDTRQPEQTKETVKTKSTLRQGEISEKDPQTLSSTMEIGKRTSHNPTTLSSISTTKCIRLEEPKLSSIEKRKMPPELPALKLSGLNLGSDKPHIMQDLKSGANTNQQKVLSTKPSMDIVQSSDLQKQIPKRKVLEKNAEDNLHPVKRPRNSLTPIRDLSKTSETVHDKVVSKEDHRIGRGLGNFQASTCQFPPQDAMVVEVMSCITETGSSIKLAEAYGKDLDDLCNALKKKNDEAKELLVRAIVNNNKLLMLNTPAFEYKIRATQKLFSELTLDTKQRGIPS